MLFTKCPFLGVTLIRNDPFTELSKCYLGGITGHLLVLFMMNFISRMTLVCNKVNFALLQEQHRIPNSEVLPRNKTRRTTPYHYRLPYVMWTSYIATIHSTPSTTLPLWIQRMWFQTQREMLIAATTSSLTTKQINMISCMTILQRILTKSTYRALESQTQFSITTYYQTPSPTHFAGLPRFRSDHK